MGASDDELIEKLVAVRGLGRWSVDMYMLFTLKRMDVFSTGDLGVQYVFVPLSPNSSSPTFSTSLLHAVLQHLGGEHQQVWVHQQPLFCHQ